MERKINGRYSEERDKERQRWIGTDMEGGDRERRREGKRTKEIRRGKERHGKERKKDKTEKERE
jgi:hypothetical protein